MGNILYGKEIAEKYRKYIRNFVQNRKDRGESIPCLATILVGDDGGSVYYINNQIRLCEELGVKAKKIFLDVNIQQSELIQIIKELNEDSSIHGIMLQVPLPKNLNEKLITSLISYKKDIDGLTDINTGRFYRGEDCFVPCTPRSIVEIIKSSGISITGKHAVIIGRSNIVGKPAAHLLLKENATVTVCHSKTQNIMELCKTADIIVAALGKPDFVSEGFIKEGAIVIDVGTTMVDGKLKGDVNLQKIIHKASFVTPVPGGVGAVTTTMLLKNLCEGIEKYVY